ncbi:MAG: branched-chain amino acid ABC transporter permease [Acetobacteraceae bacterium]
MRRTGLAVLGLAVLACVPFGLNDYQQYIANLMLVYVVVAVGFNIVLGYIGQLAFANAAFFGVGAYAAAIAMGRGHLPFLVALALAALAGGCAGALISLPAQRLRAYYLAIATLAFGELLRWTYIHADALTNGSTGLAVPTAYVFAIPLATDRAKYYLFLVLTVLVLWSTANLLASRFGRTLIAVRENEPAAGSVGISPSSAKVFAFVWSGAVVGVAGAMFAVLLDRISPDSFDLSQLLLHFTIVMIGGLGSLVGSVAGAVLLTALPELLRDIPGMEEIAFSVLLILILLFLPGGLAGLIERVVPWLRDRYFLE